MQKPPRLGTAFDDDAALHQHDLGDRTRQRVPHRAVLSMMAVRHGAIQRQRQAIRADRFNATLLDQRVIVAGGDDQPLTGAPVDRLRKAHRVLARCCGCAQRHP
jgi:hypothetical protein